MRCTLDSDESLSLSLPPSGVLRFNNLSFSSNSIFIAEIPRSRAETRCGAVGFFFSGFFGVCFLSVVDLLLFTLIGTVGTSKSRNNS